MTIAMVRGLNHLTIAVSNLTKSIEFYHDALGMRLDATWNEGAYLSAGELWLCLTADSETRAGPLAEYTHFAFDVAAENLAATVSRVEAHGAESWRTNSSEGDSYYFLDPDGHKMELHVGDLKSRLDHYRAVGRSDIRIF